jgi:hypothetical protein
MPARGEHDDFETAEAVVHAGLAALAAGDWETVRALSHEDAEHVTRDGVFFGPERMISEFSPQLERWTVSFYLEELIDAGGGALVLLLEVERRNPQTGLAGDRPADPPGQDRLHGGLHRPPQGTHRPRRAGLSRSAPRSRRPNVCSVDCRLEAERLARQQFTTRRF